MNINIELFMLRRAETDYNAYNQLVAGRSNHLPLSEKDIKQAEKAGELFREQGIKFEKIFCSATVRTCSTLKIIIEKANITNNPVDYSDDLLELSQGEWEDNRKFIDGNPSFGSKFCFLGICTEIFLTFAF